MKSFYSSVLLLMMIASSPLYAVELNSLRGKMPINAASVATQTKMWKDGKGRIDRNYKLQPPMIPHKIEGYDINLKGNTCLGCHSWENAKYVSAPKVALSHFFDRKSKFNADIAGNRYFCTQCHAPQKEAPALIPNDYQSVNN